MKAISAITLFKQSLFLLVLVFCANDAKADLITELGVGYKFGESYVVSPKCATVILPSAPDSVEPLITSEGFRRSVPCGGDNPIFVGWPLAWDFPNSTRIGWFHYSNWFDGRELSHTFIHHGDQFESDFNCLCITHTFHYRRKR